MLISLETSSKNGLAGGSFFEVFSWGAIEKTIKDTGFAIWELKHLWVFDYFNVTTAVGVLVFAIRLPNNPWFLYALASQLR